MKKETIAGLALVFIDIFNLAEQFGIYYITNADSLDQTSQQRFFFILFGIGGACLIQPMCLWSKLKVIFSMFIETGELIAYLTLLPLTTDLIVVASVFYAVEIILHIIDLYAIKSNLDEITSTDCLRGYCCFPIRILFYGLIYSSPILFLFLDPNSKFRDTYYENLLILNVFFGVIYIDLTFESCCVSESEPSDDEIIYRIWQYVILIIYNILAMIIMITTMVFAGQAIRSHATGEHVLSQYDFGVYIYCLVNYGLLACAQLTNCCNLCLSSMAKVGVNK
jgi:hypothetical protein